MIVTKAHNLGCLTYLASATECAVISSPLFSRRLCVIGRPNSDTSMYARRVDRSQGKNLAISVLCMLASRRTRTFSDCKNGCLAVVGIRTLNKTGIRREREKTRT